MHSRKIILLFLAIFTFSFVAAQVPQAINYQAIARDGAGNILANQAVGIKINILNNAPTGPVEYSERHTTTTNQFGLFTLQVGRGVPITGAFANIQWTNANQWLQVEMDPNGGTSYYLMGTSELITVPFAFYANEVENVDIGLNDLNDVSTTGVTPGQVIVWNGSMWMPGNDNDTQYQAGTGLSLVGTTFHHDPHTGDAIGATNLTVVGLQTVPVSSAMPNPDDVLKYNASTMQWEPAPDSSGAVLFGGNGISINNDTINNTVWLVTGANATRDTGSVGIGTHNPDPSAILDLSSTDKGFLPPRMTATQMNSILNPADGLIVYNTTDSMLQYYNGICWLATFQQDCDDCLFDFDITDTAGVINRTTMDTTGTTIVLNQTSGNPTNISLFLVHNLPAGATANLSQLSVFNSGTSRLTIESDVFADPGTYPIAIQAVCGNQIKIKVFEVTIDSCYQVTVMSAQQNYDLQAAAGLPGPGTPICVVVDVLPGVDITSTTITAASYTNGNLDLNSHVGIRNYGSILGRGGDGGAGGSFTTFGDPGEDGGDAINMTCRTHVLNLGGFIFGGGGGGGSVALEVISIPILGTLTIGAGGGGGAGGGQGGNSALAFLYDAGQNGGTSAAGTGGQGGLLNIPISIPLTAATVTVTPNAVGGDGGDYGLGGGTGVIFVNIDVSIPIIGSVFNQNFPNPPPAIVPPGGQPGWAIKRNSNTLEGVVDGNYQTTFMKGVVGP